MQRIITFGLIAAVALSTVPVHAAGSSLLDQAMQRANTIQLGTAAGVTVQQVGCPAAAEAGGQDGRQRQGMVGWFLGGLVLPIIMPIVAHVSTPQPPAETVLQYSGDDARCYAAAYSGAAGSKRKRGAWIGSAAAVALIVVAVASSEPEFRYR